MNFISKFVLEKSMFKLTSKNTSSSTNELQQSCSKKFKAMSGIVKQPEGKTQSEVDRGSSLTLQRTSSS